jgi:hypothetical protein
MAIATTLPLEAVDSAFGPRADLYRTVLGVRPNASTEQIQKAYFDRRNSLFQVLADLEAESELDAAKADARFQAEREMDAMVITLRILGDPVSRAKYDDIRMERTGSDDAAAELLTTLQQPTYTVYSMEENDTCVQKPKKSALKKNTYQISVIDQSMDDTTITEMESDVGDHRKGVSYSPSTTSQPPARNAKRKARRVSPDEPRKNSTARQKKKQNLNDSMVLAAESDMGSVSEGSFRTLRTVETSLTTYEQKRGCFQTIHDEVMGALDDTGRSIHQVFSVFTLRESEIDAVAGRIQKAQKQMIHSLGR